MLSVGTLWMDYFALTDKLAKQLKTKGILRLHAANEAGRLCVDQVTLDLISKPVTEMYTRQNRMDLETVTVSPAGLQMLCEFKRLP
jgi:hypothetical protein